MEWGRPTPYCQLVHVLVPVLEEGGVRGGEWWLDLMYPRRTEQAEATNAREPRKGRRMRRAWLGTPEQVP